MPDPSNYASEDAWMEACVPTLIDEGRDQDQAVAACSSMWRDKTWSAPGGLVASLTNQSTTVRADFLEQRAWSVLTVKSVDAEQRTIEGIASTPSVDRMGDIVEPLGAQFTLPMSLLHHHDHRSPVGNVIAAKATKDGIVIKAKLEREDEPGLLKDRLDLAWQELKHGLVRGLSIGFKPLEYEALKEGGLRFTKWAWHELSLVTIPAQADAQISLIKSLDADLLAASGTKEIGSTPDGAQVASSSRPGAPGKSKFVNLKSRSTGMSKTATEMVAELEARRAANTAAMETIMAKAMEEGRSTESDEQEKFDELDVENEKIDGDLKRYRTLEKSMKVSAKPVEQVKSAADASTARSGGHVRITSPNPEPGIAFARVIKAFGMAKGNAMQAAQIAEMRYGDDPRIANILKMAAQTGQLDSDLIAKAAVEVGATSSWGTFLVGDETSVVADFATFLRPQTILGKFGTNGIPALRTVPFRTPLLKVTGGGDAYWTGEGKGKGVTSFTGERTTLEPLKAANIVVLTDELVRDGSPSAERMVRDEMARALVARLDTDFIDPSNAGTADVKPASITNGVTPTASTGASFEAVQADFAALMAPFIAADNPPMNAVIIMSATTALSLSLMFNEFGTQRFPGLSMTGGSFQGIPVIVSEYVGESGSPTGRFVWLVNASDVYLGEGGISVDMSREASVQMDSAPTNSAIESGSPGQAVPSTLLSFWQTNVVGFRCEKTINWKLRRTSAVSGLSSVQWGA